MTESIINVREHSTSPPPLPFTAPWMLAPMEGVTEPCFRDLVLRRNGAADLGGAFTEFVRVVDIPTSAKKLLEHLGPERFDTPVGLQIMGSNPEAVAETAHRAAEIGAPLIDLNFGCPSKGARQGCAGSAMLDDPDSVERLVAAVRAAIPNTPLSAKIRAGGDDDSLLEDLARAAEAGGAQLLTIHCRTRAEAYRDTADWNRLARAVAVVTIPVCGNGGISKHADLEAMRVATGCRYGMIGRAAVADPWIFSNQRATPKEALQFLIEYAELLKERYGLPPRRASARLKQLIRYWTAGELFNSKTQTEWLRRPNGEEFIAALRELVSGAASQPL